MKRYAAVLATLSLLAGACTGLQPVEPVDVTVSGVESLPGEGLELRLLLKLRVQNPNDQPIDYDGASLKLEVQGRTFATGVSDVAGTVPRFGEAVIDEPVTVSAMRMVRQVMGTLDGESMDRIRYDMTGKLNGSARRDVRFRSEGELRLPGTSTPNPGP